MQVPSVCVSVLTPLTTASTVPTKTVGQSRPDPPLAAAGKLQVRTRVRDPVVPAAFAWMQVLQVDHSDHGVHALSENFILKLELKPFDTF